MKASMTAKISILYGDMYPALKLSGYIHVTVRFENTTVVARCAYGLILMAVYWMTEAFPLPVTAMLPLVIFPMMGVGTVKELATKYYNDITFVFIGGYGIASAIEKWRLHKRFAILFLMLMGTQPKWYVW
ncbi:hypothetical protein KUTeg_009603 [Tegillarca granosa]|uniref:Uncharacterized protein n=1 Tax=Tegillarca granosa TaxID=220873 RepID=A0ABQ9F4D0_TEGGR|nr:hypothetical protein KUTeg_009603 [Tegillarca granosa]